MKTIVVVAGILSDGDKILLCKRPQGKAMAGYWELPGGKVEAGESHQDAITRELQEELAIVVKSLYLYRVLSHCYDDWTVNLFVYQISDYQHCAIGNEGQLLKWLTINQVHRLQLLPTMVPICQSLALADVCWITPESVSLPMIKARLLSGIRLVQLRSKQVKSKQFINRVYHLCQRYHAKLLINTADMDFKIDCTDGFHLNTGLLHRLKKRPVGFDCLLSVACHNSQDLEKASQLQADFALLSPVCQTPTHTDAVALGWQKTQHLITEAKLPVMLLGGLSKKHLKKAQQINAIGIAGIRLLD